MKIRAPFTLHTVGVVPMSGQAPGEYWYMVPFRLWKRRVFAPGSSLAGTRSKLSFEYATSPSEGQLIGSMAFYAGQSTWRKP